MPAEQRHRASAVVRQSENRRLGGLVAQQRRERPDQDPGRAHADDGDAGAEQRGEMGAETVERLVGAVGAMYEAVDARAVERRGGAARRRHAARAEDHHRGGRRLYRHALPRLCTSTIEK